MSTKGPIKHVQLTAITSGSTYIFLNSLISEIQLMTVTREMKLQHNLVPLGSLSFCVSLLHSFHKLLFEI